MASYPVTGSEGTTLTSTHSEATVYNVTNPELAKIGYRYGDQFGWMPLFGFLRQISETMTASSVVSKMYAAGAVMADVAHIMMGQTPKFNYHMMIGEKSFKLNDMAFLAVQAMVNEGVSLHQIMAAARAMMMMETVKVSQTDNYAALYTATVRDLALLTSVLEYFIGASLSDGFDVSGVANVIYAANASVSNNVGVTDTMTPTLQIIVLENESATLTDYNGLQAIYQEAIGDGLSFPHSYLLPSGGGTTWVLNTRTGAVTEYTNYNFNSFARMGNAGLVYLGATSTGLYSLNGPDDAGTPIIADIIGGLLQFSGGQLSSITGAYLAVRGDSSIPPEENIFYLKLRTGGASGKETVYRATPISMKTTRIDLGKGLRARYFQYELVSSGQDFDLDSLEFIPIQQMRRIGV